MSVQAERCVQDQLSDMWVSWLVGLTVHRLTDSHRRAQTAASPAGTPTDHTTETEEGSP